MKKLVTVITKMNANGQVIPLSIIWEDGNKFDIDKIIDISNKAGTKGGGCGKRYTCQIGGQQRYLFLDEYSWFVEV
ncbi:MAG: hypothetical protein RR334_02670 [Clostridia bacterium]